MKRFIPVTVVGVILILLIGIIVNYFSKSINVEETEMNNYSGDVYYVFDDKTKDVLEHVKEIENKVASEIGEENIRGINNGTLAFLRMNNYGFESDGIVQFVWNTYAGSFEEETGVGAEQYSTLLTDVKYNVKSIKNIYEPNSLTMIDFDHITTIIDLYYTDMKVEDKKEKYYDYVLGWGGDIEGLAYNMELEIQNGNVSFSDDREELAKQLLGNVDTYFSEADLLADIDGVNIAKMMNERDILLSEAIEEYYLQGVFINREKLFVDTFESEENFSEVVLFIAYGNIEPRYAEDMEMLEFFESLSSMREIAGKYFVEEDVEITDESREAAGKAFIEYMLDYE